MPQGLVDANSGIVLVAMGANATSHAGNTRETVAAASEALGAMFDGVKVSNFYQTPAFPKGSGPDFVNAACAFHSDLQPDTILAALHDIEAAFGRTRDVRWGQRSLDLDLIACGQGIFPDQATFAHWRDLPIEAQESQAPDRLILPHPRLQDRGFVLIPLADVAPDWCHPVSGKTVAGMAAALSAEARGEITRLT